MYIMHIEFSFILCCIVDGIIMLTMFILSCRFRLVCIYVYLKSLLVLQNFSTARKSFSVCEEMLPLFRAVLKYMYTVD